MGNRNCIRTELGRAKDFYVVEDEVSIPADCKDGADGKNHQSNSLPYLQHTLCTERCHSVRSCLCNIDLLFSDCLPQENVNSSHIFNSSLC